MALSCSQPIARQGAFGRKGRKSVLKIAVGESAAEMPVQTRTGGSAIPDSGRSIVDRADIRAAACPPGDELPRAGTAIGVV